VFFFFFGGINTPLFINNIYYLEEILEEIFKPKTEIPSVIPIGS